MAVNHDHGALHPDQAPVGLGLLNRGVIEAHLGDISELDRHALLDVLVPHRYLLEYDPAAYVIKSHDESSATEKGVAVQTSYDLGVTFGRSLMELAASKTGATLPVIGASIDEEKQKLVDDYLRRARRTRFSRLTRNDGDIHPDITRAANLFAQRCEVVIPDKMLDGTEELRRGLHDYLSVIDILESAQERAHMRRRLGGVMMLGMFASYTLLRRSRHESA